MVKNLEFNSKYPEIVPRRYGIMLHHDSLLTLVDPIDFLLADAFIQNPSELKTNISNFLKSCKSSSVIDLEKKVTNNIKKDTKKNEIFLMDLTVDELYNVIKNGLQKKNNTKLLWGSKNRIIKKVKLKDKQIKLYSHAGGIILSGTVASKSKGWHNVEITGSYTKSKKPLQKIICDCNDARYIRMKSGYQHLSHTCFNAATLLTFANKFISDIPNFERYKDNVGKNGFFVPFRYKQNQVIETLIAHYVQNISKPQISKKLLKNVEFHPSLNDLLLNHQADLQVIPNVNYSNLYDGLMMNLINKIKSKLEISGYHLNGSCVYEKKGTDFESVSINFEKIKTDGSKYSARVYIKDGPPVIIYRKTGLKQADINSIGKIDNISPWNELLQVKAQRDDKYSNNSRYEVRLPIFKDEVIPLGIHEDYVSKLKEIYGNNLGKFKQRIMAAFSKNRISKEYKNELFRFIS